MKSYHVLAPLSKAPGPDICFLAAGERNRAGPSCAWSPQEAALRGGRGELKRDLIALTTGFFSVLWTWGAGACWCHCYRQIGREGSLRRFQIFVLLHAADPIHKASKQRSVMSVQILEMKKQPDSSEVALTSCYVKLGIFQQATDWGGRDHTESGISRKKKNLRTDLTLLLPAPSYTI